MLSYRSTTGPRHQPLLGGGRLRDGLMYLKLGDVLIGCFVVVAVVVIVIVAVVNCR